MTEILSIFKSITKIPHCSGETCKLREWIIEFAEKCGYKTETDRAGNVRAFNQSAKLCLQAHYDMVCVGDAPKIEVFEENGFLQARNSSLGADNGIAVAMMLKLMKKYDNLEFLFTNDEEIGLVGAFNLELKVEAPYMLNLDAEDDRYVLIGCAGGEDVEIEYPIKRVLKKGSIGEVEVKNLEGGHSGVDIDKNIPNAIKELLKRVENVIDLSGGEKRNSIPSSARAKMLFSGEEEIEVIDNDYLEFLKSLPHGVLEYDFKFKVVSKSVNLALVDNEKIELSFRANSNEKLEEVKDYLKKKIGDIPHKFHGFYPAWSPEINELSEKLKNITGTEYEVIHAGLECGVLSEKLGVKITSYGPNIYHPHSIHEKVEIASIQKVYENIEKLIKEL